MTRKTIEENKIKSLEQISEGMLIKINQEKAEETGRKDLGVIVNIDKVAKGFTVYTKYKKSTCEKDHVLMVRYNLYGENLKESTYQYFHNTEKPFNSMNEEIKEAGIN